MLLDLGADVVGSPAAEQLERHVRQYLQVVLHTLRCTILIYWRESSRPERGHSLTDFIVSLPLQPDRCREVSP